MGSFTDLIDLASERLGGGVLIANDEFFAPKEAMLKPGAPEWRADEYTERGKWMDGWETRRRRTPGHDWAIVRLGTPGVIRGVVIDTTWFTGNYPESASIDAASVEGTPSAEWLTGSEVRWEPLLEKTALEGNTTNELKVDNGRRFTHLRLNIFPDGGVARLRVHGEVIPSEIMLLGREVDLAAMENGGYVVSCSDMHYGHRQNLILPGRSTHMGDGWETKRRRGPGNDWTIVRLARRGTINRVELDTDHFKGNAPGSCMIEVCDIVEIRGKFDPDKATWTPLIAESPTQPHSRHRFVVAVPKTVTHVRLNIYPDGGVARLRLFGMAE
ncbi:MAG: allantoicase [Gemmatimonadota bacterium]|nr:allantoicase [Gemmatimonadota bacterium]